MNGAIALNKAKKYVDETLKGAGALKGEKGDDGITPHIGDNGNWFIGTTDTGVNAQGEDGFSPKISQTEITGGYRVTVTDADGTHSFDIMNGEDGIGVSGVEKTGTDELTDTYRMSFTDGTHYDYQVKNGEQGLQGLPGAQGEPGVPGRDGLQGIQGEKGEDGYPFLIYKEYDSLDNFNAADFPEIGLMFMVKTADENGSFPVYRYTGEGETPYSYITGLSNGESIRGEKGDPGQDGEQGVPGRDGTDGKTYSPVIGEVRSISADQTASASVVLDDDALTAKYNFNIPRGKDGTSVTISENQDNTDDYYRLDVKNGDNEFTTPNLMGVIGMEYKNASAGTPVGEVIAFMGKIIPPNYLACDGTVYAIADYPYLAKHFADNFGSKNYFGGNGVETFAVPDLRGEFLRGTGTNSHANQGNGGEVGNHQDATTIPLMLLNTDKSTIQAYWSGIGREDMAPSNRDYASKLSQKAGFVKLTTYTPNTTNSIYTTRPTNTSVQFCIKYQPTYWITPTNEPGNEGTTNYNDLQNKPQINGIVLAGNLTLEQLGITGYIDEAIQNSEIDVSADFLTTDGFGNLRYYNGKFQAYKNGAWVDVAPTLDNTIVVNMMPNPMQRIIGIYDHEAGKNKLKWLEPNDTVVDGQIICVVDKVIIRRKLGSVPQNESDGDLVIEVLKKDFNSHNTEWYFDEGVTPTLGDIYYYKAFPISTTGFSNGASVNEVSIEAKDHYLLGFSIIESESDTKSKKISVADNCGFKGVHMDFASEKFDYGDYGDFWFIRDRKDCMLRYDGTVAYYLDPNDESKKMDGTPSDVSNADFEGNAMSQNPATYWKYAGIVDGNPTYYFSDKKIDDTFVYWQNLDENGDFTPYWYKSKYEGVVINGKRRSLSGYMPTSNTTRQQEITTALANNVDGSHAWYTDVMCDRVLFTLLCVLMSDDLNSQNVYGHGNNNSYVSTSNTGVKKTGTLDGKGAFFGYADDKNCVKILGCENPYGNIWKALAGWINDKGTQKVKMTYSQADGSTVDGYNLDGTGYIEIPDSTPGGTSGGYISKMLFTDCGMIPKQASGSATTHYADGLWFNNSQVNYALVGGASTSGLLVGAFSSTLYNIASFVSWNFGAALSCKPLASIQNGGEL